MSNPFANLQLYGDDDDNIVKVVDNKPKKYGQGIKKPKEEKKVIQKQEPVNRNQNLITRQRDDAMVLRDRRQPKPNKDIPTGHYLDRRSGTGRLDKPRKEGGGKGNIGNLHDEKIKEKYLKEGQENQENKQLEQAPEQPQGITLEQYYQSKGIDINLLANNKKEIAQKKKQDINAQWIKTQKLTVLETKEDKKTKEKNQNQKKKKEKQDKQQSEDTVNNQLLGFNNKPKKRDQQKQAKPKKDNKPKTNIINLDDFPSL